MNIVCHNLHIHVHVQLLVQLHNIIHLFACVKLTVNVYVCYFRDTCAEVLLEDDGDDQSLPAAILDALMKVHVHNMGVYTC